MFNVGSAELLVVLLVALIVLGPNKLPDAARKVGKAAGELRRLSSGFQRELHDAMNDLSEPVRSVEETIRGTAPPADASPPSLSKGTDTDRPVDLDKTADEPRGGAPNP